MYIYFVGGGGGWQGIIGTMRCCVLDNYKRKQNMVPTMIEQDDFRFFYDIKWYPQVSLIEKTTHHKTSKSLGDMFQSPLGVKGSCSKTLVRVSGAKTVWCKGI